MRVADAALVVVSAVTGVEVRTEKAWTHAKSRAPRSVVLNQLDRERRSFERSLDRCSRVRPHRGSRSSCRSARRSNFSGVVDLVAMKGYTFAADGSGKMTEGPVPTDMSDAAASAREALIEMVAEADEALMENFFDAGTLDAGRAARRPDAARRPRVKDLPSRLHVGARQPRRAAALDAIVALRAVAAAERPFTALDATGGASSRPPMRRRPYAAFVWKTVADQFAGRITMFRVYQGALKSDSTVQNRTQGSPEAPRPSRGDAGQDPDDTFRRSTPATSAPWPS